MENKEEVKLKYHVPGSVTFRNEFHMVEKGVVAAATHFGTLEHSVFIGTAVAMRYVRRRAWILATNFTQYFHVHIEDPGMSTKLYSILGFEHEPVQGAVLQLLAGSTRLAARCYRIVLRPEPLSPKNLAQARDDVPRVASKGTLPADSAVGNHQSPRAIAARFLCAFDHQGL